MDDQPTHLNRTSGSEGMNGTVGGLNHTQTGLTLTAEEIYQGLGPMLLVVCWSMTAVAALFLAARLYVKLTTHKRLWWDDHLLVASWFMLVAFSATTTCGIKYGLGIHFQNLKNAPGSRPSDMNELQLVLVVATVFSVMGAAWSKTSFALTLLRITSGMIHHVIWFIIVTMNIVLTFNAILQFLWCQPASVAWSSGSGGTCWSKSVIIYYSIAAAAYSAAMDIILAMVPWAVIMKLNMEPREKIGVAVCMSLGFIAGITSIFRAVHIPATYSDDYTYDESSLFVWTAAELATTITAASIPVLRALLRRIVSSTQRTRARTGVNTFKSGTYMCSTVSRTQSYRRMEGGTLPGTKQRGGNGNLGSISENGESVSSLVVAQESGADKFQGYGGIMKTEEITVDYGRRDRHDEGGQANNSALGFELEEVPPVAFVRSASTKH